ncbi:spidroin-2-like [Equus przewalskii]|uniref:Spidroin-2-like n=1 Tax=Equus przewalskii TaxID=9798 RepID=A0ABM4MKW8_EQUPR
MPGPPGGAVQAPRGRRGRWGPSSPGARGPPLPGPGSPRPALGRAGREHDRGTEGTAALPRAAGPRAAACGPGDNGRAGEKRVKKLGRRAEWRGAPRGGTGRGGSAAEGGARRRRAGGERGAQSQPRRHCSRAPNSGGGGGGGGERRDSRPTPARPWPGVRRALAALPRGGTSRPGAGEDGRRAPSQREPRGARLGAAAASGEWRPRPGAPGSGRRKRPGSAARGGAGAGAGGQGRGASGRRERSRPAGCAGGREEPSPGRSRLPCRGRLSPGTRGPGRRAGQVVELAPGSPIVGRPARPRSRAGRGGPAGVAPRSAAPLGRSPRCSRSCCPGVLGGAGRSSPPLARGPPCAVLAGFGAGKSDWERGALPGPQDPQARPSGLFLRLRRARRPGPEASTITCSLSPKPGSHLGECLDSELFQSSFLRTHYCDI